LSCDLANEASAMKDPVITESPARIISPRGAALTSTGNIDQGHIVYRANKNDCSICSLNP
jgi:hypothetical protein